MNQEKKSAYDARLREQLEAIEGGQRLRSQSQNVKQNSKSKVEKASSEPTLTARKKKHARGSNPSQLAKARKAKTAQQTDSTSTAPSKPERLAKRPLFIAGAVLGLILIAVTAFFMIGGGESPPQTDIDAGDASQVAESNNLSPPVEKTPVGSGGKVIVQPEISKKDSPTESTQREKESTVKKPETEQTDGTKENASEKADDENAADEKSPSDSEVKKPTPVKKEPLRFVELEVQKKDTTSTVFRYEKQNGYFIASEKSPKQIPYRLKIKAPLGPFIGLCLEAYGAEYESATLAGVEVRAPKKVTWSSATDSVGQGGAAALVADETEWTMSYNGRDPIWAVFTAEKPLVKRAPIV